MNEIWCKGKAFTLIQPPSPPLTMEKYKNHSFWNHPPFFEQSHIFVFELTKPASWG